MKTPFCSSQVITVSATNDTTGTMLTTRLAAGEVPSHPLLSMTVTVYEPPVPVVMEVDEPVLDHVYDTKPGVADKVDVSPSQMERSPVISGSGSGFTVTDAAPLTLPGQLASETETSE